MSPQEIRETGRRLLKSRQYAEAIPLLKSAANSFPEDGILWRELVTAAKDFGQIESAIEFAKQAIQHHPRCDWLWRNLGGQLIEAEKLDEAEQALNNSKALNATAPWLWQYFAKLYQKRRNYEAEIKAWEHLRGLNGLTAVDLHHFGIAYYNHGNHAKAIELFRATIAANANDATIWLNLGVAFNHPEVAQETDAADAYRCALAINPQSERAQAGLETVKKKLLPLAERAQNEITALNQTGRRFQFYANPFEVFPLDSVDGLSALDPKLIQRAKNQLLGEIELSDGKVSWLGNEIIDRARALALENELYDGEKRRFHWAVFENKRLLRFLTRGEVGHFLYSDEYFPQKTLQLLDATPEFRAFISKPFARQYNLLLNRAFEKSASATVEALFDGRRWVLPEDEDICFEGALKQIGDMVSQFGELAEQGKKLKIEPEKIRELLSQKNLFHLFNLLPATFAFRQAQGQLISHIRTLGIDYYNEHADLEIAVQVIGLCQKFRFKDAKLNQQLTEDIKALEKIQNVNRRYSFSALVRRNETVSISNAGIKCGGNSINATEVKTLRWGIYIRRVNGITTEHSYTLVVNSAQGCLQVRWDKSGLMGAMKNLFQKKDDIVPISQLETKEQELHFRKMIDAVVHHLVRPLVTRVVQQLEAGESIDIGSCLITKSGITFRAGIFLKQYDISWHDAETQMSNGGVAVYNRQNRRARISMSARDTDNAVILPFLCETMRLKIPAVPPEQSERNGEVSEGDKTTPWAKIGGRLLVVMGAIVVFGLLYACNSLDHQSSNSNDYVVPTTAPITLPAAPPPPAIIAAPPNLESKTNVNIFDRIPVTANPEPKTNYMVPSYMTNWLEQDSEVIDREKAADERMTAQLDALDRDIKQSTFVLDRASQPAVDAFNVKVDTYNSLLEKERKQNLLVNQLVDKYNAKLKTFGQLDIK
ncbi:MAG TPA: tetratricopeptide repeat protein [Verrucomicrobiae bacterium]